jgi:hypothetical protein
MIPKRKCFGTVEYSKISGICRSCYHYIECGKVKKKKIPPHKKLGAIKGKKEIVARINRQ